MPTQFQYRDLTIQLYRRKNAKCLSLRSHEGGLRLSAPKYASKAVIDTFLERNYEHILQVLAHSQQTQRRYVSGEKISLLGSEYTLKCQFSHENKCYVQEQSIVVLHKENVDIEKLVLNFFRQTLYQVASGLLPQLQQRMGLQAEELRIRDMRTRWGTCNYQKRRIWLSLMLVQKDIECISYVLVHELAHFLEHSHNKRFWLIVETYCPTYKEIMKRMHAPTL